MRKLLLSIMVLVAGATAAKAQFFVGGGLGFWDNKPVRWFSISPDAGYSFNKHWTAGLSIVFDWHKDSDWSYYTGTVKTTSTYFKIEPYARFKYFSTEKVNLFLDGVVGVSVHKLHSRVKDPNHSNDIDIVNPDPTIGFQVIIRPGIAVNLTEHFCLVGTFGALGYRQDYGSGNDGFGLDFSNSLRFGFYYSF